MKFSNEEIKRLEKAWKNKEELTIHGVNGYGQKFSTTGRIATTDSGKLAMDEVREDSDCIYLEFGKTKTFPEITEYLAPFFTGFIPTYYSPDLYIYEISDSNGKTIFNNYSADDIARRSAKAGEAFEKNMKKEGRYIDDDNMDEISKKLKNMIGKPIIIKSPDGVYSGVFICINGANNKGLTEIIIEDVFATRKSVPVWSALYTENNEGEKDLLAYNDGDTVKKIDARKAKMLQAQKRKNGERID